MKTVDRWQVSQGAPLKVGVLIPTDLTIDNAGDWSTLPDGKKVWRLQVQAKDAIALMLSFKDFYIPENGKLFIYSSDKTHLIGAPVPGTMTAVWWESQIDPSIVFGIPQVGMKDMQGRYLENLQLEPDIEVYNSPESQLKGEDHQLEEAVKEMLKEVNKK